MLPINASVRFLSSKHFNMFPLIPQHCSIYFHFYWEEMVRKKKQNKKLCSIRPAFPEYTICKHMIYYENKHT